MTTLSHSQAKILVQHHAGSRLYDFENVSHETATLFSQYPYELGIDLDNLSESDAASLRKDPSFADEKRCHRQPQMIRQSLLMFSPWMGVSHPIQFCSGFEKVPYVMAVDNLMVSNTSP